MTELEQYFERHARPASRYEGQLEPEFQVELAAHYGWRTEDECTFSHTVQLPDGRVQEGAWDLRGLEDAVLGYCDLAGRRVLEYGPASGWLTAHIAPTPARRWRWSCRPGASATSCRPSRPPRPRRRRRWPRRWSGSAAAGG